MNFSNSTQNLLKLLGSYEQLCSNLSPEEIEENDEAAVELTEADSETNGKQLWVKYSHTQFEIHCYKYLIGMK